MTMGAGRCRAGKAVTIAKPSDQGHKEEVADLVDNKLLDEHDTAITVTPVISRHELEGEACTFVVLASAALSAALEPQQVVDSVSEAIKVGTCCLLCMNPFPVRDAHDRQQLSQRTSDVQGLGLVSMKP